MSSPSAVSDITRWKVFSVRRILIRPVIGVERQQMDGNAVRYLPGALPLHLLRVIADPRRR